MPTPKSAFCSTLLLALTCGCGAALVQQQNPVPTCGSDEIARAIVSRIIDCCTLALDDGREVRLAAVEVPTQPAA